MRSMFPEWYSPEIDEVAMLVREGTIAFDANALLDLYRVSDVQRDEILSVLMLVQERLFIPYQVALEYQRGRLGVVSTQQKAHDALADGVRKAFDGLEEDVKSKSEAIATTISNIRDKDIKEELTEELKVSIKQISEQVEKSRTYILKSFSEIKSGHIVEFNEAKSADPVRNQLDAILTADKVGSPPDGDELKKHTAEGHRRVKEHIPPGYEDAKKDDPTGDYRIWRELLDFARDSSRNLIFVTNDEKDDWYQISHGQKIGPRPELKQEMAIEARKFYHQTTLSGFLAHAKKYLNASLSDETIASVSNVRIQSDDGGVWSFEGRVDDVRVVIRSDGVVNYAVLIDCDDVRHVAIYDNYSDLKRAGVLIGDSVYGGIAGTGFAFIGMPNIDVRTGYEREILLPSECPECGTRLHLWDAAAITLACTNSKYCPAQNR